MNAQGAAARITRALISVSDKTGVVELARGLARHGVEILSTGGTAKMLREAGLAVRDVAEYTGFPEILDGRVKTLHPKVHGGLLGRRDLAEHVAAMAQHGIAPIDLVCVNLYPFHAVTQRGCSFEEAIENIDIGGPSMLRSAAKNHASVTVLVDPEDYPQVLAEMEASGGATTLATRIALAQKAFRTTAAYDGRIADYLGALGCSTGDPFGETLHLGLERSSRLRYGENPHQQAALYRESGTNSPDFLSALEQLHGKELSYNNLVDIDAALRLMLDFEHEERAVLAILKHNTPCGVGAGATVCEAYEKAFQTDPDSPFGGILITNRTWDRALAGAVDEIFSEVLIAPDFSEDALARLRAKKNRRLIRWHRDRTPRGELELRKIVGGYLVQSADTAREDLEGYQVGTKRAPTPDEQRAMDFGWRVVKHVKSNAIVLAGSDRTLGIGGGQTSRVDAVRIAIEKAQRQRLDLRGAALASDAFFPFPDGVELALQAGIRAVVQPGGSVRDAEAIAAADAVGATMILTGVRHFRH